ncbi:hypothetical protein MKQ70_13980 [Chitinophaga sedimenti]|nr:hypothetical protein [Chitinophaga sedimenti]MCK7556067.1 hypothetical protein [Chitinophaga sedimenti]
MALREAPDSLAARKAQVSQGATVAVLGSYNQYHYVQHQETAGWIKL